MPVARANLGLLALTRELKLRDLPKLGREKDKDGKAVGRPYLQWKEDAAAALEAVGGAVVIHEDPPSEDAPRDDQVSYFRANALVFDKLLTATCDIPTLGDNVRRCRQHGNSSRLAWETIRSHYVRLAEGSESRLKAKLRALVPGQKESMESFLCRLNNLRGEFQDYGIEPQDVEFVAHVFEQLSLTWRQTSGFQGVPAQSISWGDLYNALIEQDNARRNSNTAVRDALLPLGWYPRAPEGTARSAHATGE